MMGSGIRKVIYLLSLPHGNGIRAFPISDLFGSMVAQVEKPDVRSPTSAVALPGPEVAIARRVSEPLAVTRNGPVPAVRHRQPIRQTASLLHGEQLGLPSQSTQSTHCEQEPVVERPIAETLTTGMISNPLRDSSFGGYRVDIVVPVIVAVERNSASIRTESRKRFSARRTCQRGRYSARSRDNPDIVCIDKHDMGRADIRVTHHTAMGLHRSIGSESMEE